MNKLIICGRLGKDPETANVGNTTVTKFTVATGFKKKDGTDHTDWHNVEAWEKTGEIVQKYVKKGHQILVEGEVRYQSSEKDGVKHYFTKVVASKIHLLDNKDKQQASTTVTQTMTSFNGDFDLNNIPF